MSGSRARSRCRCRRRPARATLLARPAGTVRGGAERTYGFRAPDDEPVELIGLIGDRARHAGAAAPAGRAFRRRRATCRPAAVPGSRARVDRNAGGGSRGVVGRRATGPLIVQEYDATCLVPAGATAALDAFGNVRVTLDVRPTVLAPEHGRISTSSRHPEILCTFLRTATTTRSTAIASIAAAR